MHYWSVCYWNFYTPAIGNIMHYYQFNIGDYKSHTDHLTNIEDLGYRRLLDCLYLHEKPLPICTKNCARLVRMNENAQEIKGVLEEFFTLTENGWAHKRAMEEICEFQHKQDVARANGKKGGRPKKAEKTQLVNLGNQQESELQTKHKTLNINHKPLTINQSLKDMGASKADAQEFCTQQFERVWLTYPTKKNKKRSLQLWKNHFIKNKTIDSSLVANDLIADIEKRCSSQQLGFDKLHFTTYFNGERWNDDYTLSDQQLREQQNDSAINDFLQG